MTAGDAGQAAFERFCREQRAAPAAPTHAGREFLVVKSVVDHSDVFIALMNAKERIAMRFADTGLITPPCVGACVTLRTGLHLVPCAATRPPHDIKASRVRAWLNRWLRRCSRSAPNTLAHSRVPSGHGHS